MRKVSGLRFGLVILMPVLLIGARGNSADQRVDHSRAKTPGASPNNARVDEQKEYYDWSKSWCTHVSMQSASVSEISNWRNTYGKPVIDDEYQYEGNVRGWGNLGGEESTRRMWTCIIEGGYGTHGESYGPVHFFWKGGTPQRYSFARCAWMSREIFNDSDSPMPGGLTPVSSTQAVHGDDYILYYCGETSTDGSKTYDLPGNGRTYRVDVIDTWNMTISSMESFSGMNSIPQNPLYPALTAAGTILEKCSLLSRIRTRGLGCR